VAASQQVLVLLNLPPQHYRPDGNYAGSYADAAGRAARRRVAAQLAREHGLAMDSDWPMPLLGVDCFVMTVPPEQSPGRIAQDLARDGRVAWAQTMNVFRAQGHDDPLFPVQPTARDWQLAALHDTVTGRQVRVAVIDSAVERTHPDLLRQIELSEDFVAGRAVPAEAHGTAVAGIIAAQADNGIGIVGVAPQARVLALRACWQQAAESTLCSSLSLAQALQFAITHDAKVINLSLSGPPDQLLARLLDVALGRGIAVVAAVDRGAAGGGFPAAHRGVVAVADAPSGPPPSAVVIAPGRDIPTTVSGARWALVSGSSYAAAHVAGLLALLREARDRRGATASTVASVATRDLVLLPDGRIDACASLSRAAGLCSCDCTAASAGPTVARQ
jgi:subtilisin family serine protease